MINIQLTKMLSAVSGELKLSVDVVLKEGEFIALYGPSGAGKTSILRMIAGLLQPDDGVIDVGGEIWLDVKNQIYLKTQQRHIGIVFQDYALFPNMTVKENLAYALTPGQTLSDVDDIIALMELTNLGNNSPNKLSGGQRQRVAFARAVLRRPKLLLLDEPFAALDTSLRIRMQDIALRLHRELKLTTILVTHDLIEVARLADRVFMLENGEILRSGEPRQVIPYEQFESIVQTIASKYRP